MSEQDLVIGDAVYMYMFKDKSAFGYCWVAPEPPATSWQRTKKEISYSSPRPCMSDNLGKSSSRCVKNATIYVLCKTLERRLVSRNLKMKLGQSCEFIQE